MRCEGYMLVCKDIQASKHFFTQVVGAEVEHDIGGHVIFKQGFSLLQEKDWRDFAELGKEIPVYGHRSGQLVFEVDDIEAFMRRISDFDSLTFLHGLKEHHWGRRAVRLCCPDGHVIEVGESMKVVVKRFLRQGLTPEEAAARSEFPLAFALMCKEEMERQKDSA